MEPTSAALTLAASCLNTWIHSSSLRCFTSAGTSSRRWWDAWVFYGTARVKKPKGDRPHPNVPERSQQTDLPHAVGEQEAHVVAHVLDERQGLLVVCGRLPAET